LLIDAFEHNFMTHRRFAIFQTDTRPVRFSEFLMVTRFALGAAFQTTCHDPSFLHFDSMESRFSGASVNQAVPTRTPVQSDQSPTAARCTLTRAGSIQPTLSY
tara:strand:- start:20 stop:328 length:309 start_codon:yes stop_codon:yes gene_type:complete